MAFGRTSTLIMSLRFRSPSTEELDELDGVRKHFLRTGLIAKSIFGQGGRFRTVMRSPEEQEFPNMAYPIEGGSPSYRHMRFVSMSKRRASVK